MKRVLGGIWITEKKNEEKYLSFYLYLFEKLYINITKSGLYELGFFLTAEISKNQNANSLARLFVFLEFLKFSL